MVKTRVGDMAQGGMMAHEDGESKKYLEEDILTCRWCLPSFMTCRLSDGKFDF